MLEAEQRNETKRYATHKHTHAHTATGTERERERGTTACFMLYVPLRITGGGNPSDIYLWWILWISICRMRRS